jgi:hypothetical protein
MPDRDAESAAADHPERKPPEPPVYGRHGVDGAGGSSEAKAEPSGGGATPHCPHTRSDMTPCVLRDGDICWADKFDGKPICVGCERTPKELGLPAPVPWPRPASDSKTTRKR